MSTNITVLVDIYCALLLESQHFYKKRKLINTINNTNDKYYKYFNKANNWALETEKTSLLTCRFHDKLIKVVSSEFRISSEKGIFINFLVNRTLITGNWKLFEG